MPPSDLLKEPVMRRGNSTPSAQHALISHSSGALSETPRTRTPSQSFGDSFEASRRGGAQEPFLLVSLRSKLTWDRRENWALCAGVGVSGRHRQGNLVFCYRAGLGRSTQRSPSMHLRLPGPVLHGSLGYLHEGTFQYK